MMMLIWFHFLGCQLCMWERAALGQRRVRRVKLAVSCVFFSLRPVSYDCNSTSCLLFRQFVKCLRIYRWLWLFFAHWGALWRCLSFTAQWWEVLFLAYALWATNVNMAGRNIKGNTWVILQYDVRQVVGDCVISDVFFLTEYNELKTRRPINYKSFHSSQIRYINKNNVLLLVESSEENRF